MILTEFNLKWIEEEKAAFEKVLNTYLQCSGFINPRILNICCGVANEEPVLFDYFGRGSEIIGIDYHEPSVNVAKELGRTSVKLGCVEKLDDYVLGKFDIILGRNIPLNPSYSIEITGDFKDIWPGLIENLPRFMHSDSKLILTLLRPDEFERANVLLDKNKYDINFSEKNQIIVPNSRIFFAGSDTKDDYIIIAGKPFQERLLF